MAVPKGARHLGGYIPGGDDASYYPDLWRWLVTDYGAGLVLDVGCGEGHALDVFRDAGAEALGIDGVEQERKDILRHDYSEGFLDYDELGRWDLVWSCEFVEHVEERYVPNFLATFCCADTVLMTHAMPGQPGWHHVNCKAPEYWIGMLAGVGFRYDEKLTAQTRSLAALNQNPNNYYVRSGLAFRRP